MQEILAKGIGPSWGWPPHDLAFASRGIIPPARIILGRAEHLSDQEGNSLEIQECGCFLRIDHPRFLAQRRSVS